ncbi:MAG TPA: hypothetical protein VK932_30305 [Kofleriaceae bacterium]|nr:hypothetical protein [Kofleriaceae bacterium]
MRVASSWLGLVAGALCAIGIACGGAARYAPAPAAPEAGMPAAAGPAGDARAELDALSRQIDADLAELGLPRPPAPATACIQPPCDAEAMSAGAAPAHTADPACKPGGGETCRDACRLSDSICDSSGRICRIATDLGGGDAYANEKCASGKASCEVSRTKCCGCL